LLKALAAMPADVPFRLRVLGEGTMERRWKQLAARLGIESHVEWTGWLSLEEALEQYKSADLFAFTSVRDTSGTVILEALANGLPVVCLDHQGAHDIVTEQCGIKVPVTTPRKVVSDLRDAIARLAQDSELRAAMSNAATERAPEYLWTRQGALMQDIYRNVLRYGDEKLSQERGLILHKKVIATSAKAEMASATSGRPECFSSAPSRGHAVCGASGSREALSQL
jgi:glycosyltransferase involved in cell wall biosynthesis